MTAILRNLWYITLGAAAAWAWHRIYHPAVPPEPMVSMMLTAPASKFIDGVAGFGGEMGAILKSDLTPPDDDDSDPTADGLPPLDPNIWRSDDEQ